MESKAPPGTVEAEKEKAVTEKMIDLKPCPFCGAEAAIGDQRKYIGGRNYGYDRQYIYCTKCGCQTASYDWDDRADMVKAWNRRADGSED